MGERVDVDVDGGAVVLVLVVVGAEDDVLGEAVDTGAGPDEDDDDPGAVIVCMDALVDAEATTVGWITTTAVEARIPEDISAYFPYITRELKTYIQYPHTYTREDSILFKDNQFMHHRKDSPD